MSFAHAATQEFLTFRVGGQEYALPILEVQEIRSCESAVRLPGSANHVLGVLDLRGCIAPLYDARALLSLTGASWPPTAVHIICRHADRLVGLLVDEVLDVVELSGDKVKPLRADLLGCGGSSSLSAMACLGERRLLLTTVAELLQLPVASEPLNPPLLSA